MLPNNYIKVIDNVVVNIEILTSEWINEYGEDGHLYIEYPEYMVEVGYIYDPDTNEFNHPENEPRIYTVEDQDDII
jgi:hypothetical protein